jgi:hypothetical protein
MGISFRPLSDGRARRPRDFTLSGHRDPGHFVELPKLYRVRRGDDQGPLRISAAAPLDHAQPAKPPQLSDNILEILKKGP